MLSLATLFLAFTSSAALTSVLVRWLANRRIFATENHRSMHKGAVPTGGGWPLLAAALGPAFALWPVASLHLVIAGGIGVLAFISWADDLKTLSRSLRLTVHIGAAALLLAALPADSFIFNGVLPLVADRLLAGVALVWFMNLYNFMDGIDGIAGVETVTIAIGYAAVAFAADGAAGTFHGLAVATVGATLGFLVWNWAPARIFLGDVGSVPLGFLAGAMIIDLAIHQSLAAASILPLYFLADATITLVRRFLKGEKPWEAHRSHAYQRAALGLGSHAAVVARIAICNGLLVIVAVLALTAPGPAIAIALISVLALLISLEWAARSSSLASSDASGPS